MKIYLQKYNLLIVTALLYLSLANLVQSSSFNEKILGAHMNGSIYYFLLHFLVIALCAFHLISNRNRIYSAVDKIKSIQIPAGAKWSIAVVMTGNLCSILLGKPCYPFYDVGMFRWTTDFSNPPNVVYKPKYFYVKDGKIKILDLRKEGYLLLYEHFGIRYTHEFTFAATYHNKGQEENFNFIMNRLKPIGVDTLWVGVHAVNYETGRVWFDNDLCNAVRINKTEKIHYGPIYIPDYQLIKCNE